MGWFRKILAGPEPFVPAAFPFSGEIRMRHEEYGRLATGWWKVTIDSPEEWAAKTAEMQEGIRRHFGTFVTKDGKAIERWNERNWESVRKGLRVEKR